MGCSRGCRGMTGYGLGRGTSLLLILIFILASAIFVACHAALTKPLLMRSVRAYLYTLWFISATAISQPAGLDWVRGREAEDILTHIVISSISAAVARCELFGKYLCWSAVQHTLASLY
jgi:hypothetical protein